MAHRSHAVVLVALACAGRAVAQDVPIVNLYQGKYNWNATYPANKCAGADPDWSTRAAKAGGFCFGTPFMDQAGLKTNAEVTCTKDREANFTLYSQNQSAPGDCLQKMLFKTNALPIGKCVMTAAPKYAAPPGGFPVGMDPQFPEGAWVIAEDPGHTVCKKLSAGVGMYFNSKCTGFPQYSLHAGADTGKCVETHMGDSNAQQVMAKVTCQSGSKTDLALFACGQTGCSCQTTTQFQSLPKMNASGCFQVAGSDPNSPTYNPVFPQGAWMSPFPGTCAPAPPPPSHKGMSAGDVVLIVFGVIFGIVAAGAVGLCLMKKQQMSGDIPQKGASIYSDNLGAGF